MRERKAGEPPLNGDFVRRDQAEESESVALWMQYASHRCKNYFENEADLADVFRIIASSIDRADDPVRYADAGKWTMLEIFQTC